MSLWFPLHANTEHIGTCEVQRHEHLDLTDRAGLADVVCTYTVRVDGRDRAEVRHRYGDGPWVLLAKALSAAALDNKNQVEELTC